MLVDLSPLSHLKPCMSSFVAFGSWRISLSERSRSSSVFILFFCVQERVFLLPTTPTRAVSGRSSPMRVGFPTETHRHVSRLMKDTLF
jgi:hypothetical protein